MLVCVSVCMRVLVCSLLNLHDINCIGFVHIRGVDGKTMKEDGMVDLES